MNRRRDGQAPGTVELRLSGTRGDTGALISVLERLAAGLPVTTVGIELLHRSGYRPNRYDPGERIHLTVRVRDTFAEHVAAHLAALKAVADHHLSHLGAPEGMLAEVYDRTTADLDHAGGRP